MSEDPEGQLVCSSYTHARRHPLLIGKFQGHPLPVMLSLTQVGVLAGGVIGALTTRGLWAPLVGGGLAEIIIIVGMPLAAAFAVRHLRMEGRSPLRMAVGASIYLSRRTVGPEILGRPARQSRPCRLRSEKMFITPSASNGQASRAQTATAAHRDGNQAAATAVIGALVAARGQRSARNVGG